MTRGPSSPVYFILHIPKTAGQTIQQHLAEHCAPGVFWGPHQAPRLQALSGPRYKPRSLPEAPRVRAVFGHNVSRSLEMYFPDREIRRVVLLRDPISLHLSLYNHRMMLHLAKGLGTYSFDLHLKALPRDFVAHRLLARWLEIPWPVLFWACTADEGSKFTINPFDRVNLGYDGLFGPRTMFYHLSPKYSGQEHGKGNGNGNWTEGYSVIDIPVLKQGYADWVEIGTAAVILVGFGWVIWKLWLVWKIEGYGRHGALKAEKKKQ